MTGRPSHDAVIGVGSALQKARVHRRLTLEEAARDTKLSAEQLHALEDEDFDALGGEVYARASLRTYAAYLGLDPTKVMKAYARHADEPEPPPPPRKMGRVEQAIAATRIRDNQRFLVIAAAFVLGVLLIFGLLSRGHDAPLPAAIPTVTPSVAPTTAGIEANLTALQQARVTVTVDGVATSYAMAKDEQRSFAAVSELTIRIVDGGTVDLNVAGADLGTPGAAGRPWQETFTLNSLPSTPPPSASGLPSVSASPTA
jgi:hypothetical protein